MDVNKLGMNGGVFLSTRMCLNENQDIIYYDNMEFMRDAPGLKEGRNIYIYLGSR